MEIVTSKPKKKDNNRMIKDFLLHKDKANGNPPHNNFEILPTHIAHIAKAPRADATTKALLKCAILLTHLKETSKRYLYA